MTGQAPAPKAPPAAAEPTLRLSSAAAAAPPPQPQPSQPLHEPVPALPASSRFDEAEAAAKRAFEAKRMEKERKAVMEAKVRWRRSLQWGPWPVCASGAPLAAAPTLFLPFFPPHLGA